MNGISVAICRISNTTNTNSQKQKMFSGFLLHIWNVQNLEHFEKKDEHLSLVISEIIDERVVT